jgi:hypothetical protein
MELPPRTFRANFRFEQLKSQNQWLFGVEIVDKGDSVDSKKKTGNEGFPNNPLKTKWGRSSAG